MSRRLLVIDHKLNAIEAHEAALGGEPNVTVAGLNDGVYGVLGKAVVGLPGTVSVLAQIFLRVEAKGEAGSKREPEQQACSPEAVIR